MKPDPLAFLNPNKAFTMEGLISRDMFEEFAAEEEDMDNESEDSDD